MMLLICWPRQFDSAVSGTLLSDLAQRDGAFAQYMDDHPCRRDAFRGPVRSATLQFEGTGNKSTQTMDLPSELQAM